MSIETDSESLLHPEKQTVLRRFTYLINRINEMPHLQDPIFNGVIIDSKREGLFTRKTLLYPVFTTPNPFKLPKSQFSFIHHDYLLTGLVDEVEDPPPATWVNPHRSKVSHGIPNWIFFTINSQVEPILIQDTLVDFAAFWKGVIKPGIGNAPIYPGRTVSPEKPLIENILHSRQAVKIKDPEKYSLESGLELLGLFRNPDQTLSALSHYNLKD